MSAAFECCVHCEHAPSDPDTHPQACEYSCNDTEDE